MTINKFKNYQFVVLQFKVCVFCFFQGIGSWLSTGSNLYIVYMIPAALSFQKTLLFGKGGHNVVLSLSIIQMIYHPCLNSYISFIHIWLVIDCAFIAILFFFYMFCLIFIQYNPGFQLLESIALLNMGRVLSTRSW